MGCVYQAEHMLMGRSVALKLLHPHLYTNEEYLKRFKQEARLACRLNHPHAITLYDFGIEEGVPYLVMQYVEGRTLKAILTESGALPLQRVDNILQQAAGALSQAHAADIVHRDLKPDNILVSQEGSPQECVHVLDFGVAKLLGYQSSNDSVVSTQAGLVTGTPQYMSPEQATQVSLDRRTDIYSLGIVLYEMLTGQVPFVSDSPLGLLVKHIHELPIPVRDFKPGLNIPQQVSNVVMKALEKEPDKRYSSVEELAQCFHEAVQSTSSLHVVDAAAPAPLPPRQHQTRTYLELILLVLLLAAVFSLRYAWKASEQSSVLGLLSGGTTQDQSLLQQQLSSETSLGGSVADFSSSELQSSSSAGAAAGEASQGFSSSSAAATSEPSLDPEQVRQEAERYYTSGKKLLKDKDYINAELEFKKALALRQSHLMARLSLGLCFLRQGNSADALREFENALALDPSYGPTHYNIASYYALIQDKEKALSVLEKSIKLFPAARSWAQKDPDFASLREDSRFQQLLK